MGGDWSEGLKGTDGKWGETEGGWGHWGEEMDDTHMVLVTSRYACRVFVLKTGRQHNEWTCKCVASMLIFNRLYFHPVLPSLFFFFSS